MLMSRSAASATLRAIGPTCESVGAAVVGQTGTRPYCGLMPARPVKLHGMRIEPPPSVPSANGVMPAVTAAAAPALEPPGGFAVFHGLRGMPGDAGGGAAPRGFAADPAGGGLADRARPRLLGALDRRRVRGRDVVGHGARAETERHAADRDQVLGRERHAVQRPERVAAH